MASAGFRRPIARLFASPLSRAFAFAVISASTVITLVMTSIQLRMDYESNIASTHHALDQVERSYGSSLSASLWTYDVDLVQSQLDGIANLSQIEWVEIVSEDGSRWSAGERESTYTLERKLPLFRESGGNLVSVGQLTLLSSVDAIYRALAVKFAVILGLNMIKTLFMSMVIIFLFHRIVGRHLIDLAAYLRQLNLGDHGPDFQLRDRRPRSTDDEFDQLADAINVMRANVHASYDTVTTYKDGLEAALCKERELSGLQRQFVSMVSHEFRTPLAIIDGNAQRLQRKMPKVSAEKLNGVLATIRNSVVRLTDLMESILSSSRLEDGKIKCEPVDCDIAALLRDVCDGYRDLRTGHEIVHRTNELPPSITADPKLLRQVFSNLVSNAVKYAPEGTTIWVDARRGGRDDVVIAVRDQGVGIPKDELEKLFQRFFRASTSTGISGTGIGLHLVKHLIDMHGGSIEVESSPENGSTFTVRLPIERPADAPESEPPDGENAAMPAFAASAAS